MYGYSPSPPTEKVSLPLIHICTDAGMHNLVYKADVNEIKMKEGLGMTTYHKIVLKIKSNVAFLF